MSILSDNAFNVLLKISTDMREDRITPLEAADRARKESQKFQGNDRVALDYFAEHVCDGDASHELEQ